MTRIISLLPAATEIVAALGLLPQLVGVSHECDFPEAVNALPRVIHCPIYNVGLSSAEIDRRVRESMESGAPLYEIDLGLMRDLKPDLVLTQALCDVCAIGHGTVAGALATLPVRPQLLNLEPRRLDDLYENIRQVAEACGAQPEAELVIAALEIRVAEVQRRVAGAKTKPRVLLLEWIDPPFAAGHWTPELIEIAGGICAIGKTGIPSVTMDWDDAVAARPDVVVIACCGYSIDQIRQDIPILTKFSGWENLPAVLSGEIYAIDGSHYFNRSGPRLVDSLEMLAATLHPDCFSDIPPPGLVYRLDALGNLVPKAA